MRGGWLGVALGLFMVGTAHAAEPGQAPSAGLSPEAGHPHQGGQCDPAVKAELNKALDVAGGEMHRASRTMEKSSARLDRCKRRFPRDADKCEHEDQALDADLHAMETAIERYGDVLGKLMESPVCGRGTPPAG